MRVSHVAGATFDDPNLVSCGGLVPVAALAEQCGLGQLLERHLTVRGTAGANASTKACSVVFGMVAGADSIDDLDLLRHGGMRRLLPDVRAPSTLGTFLRAFRFGHVRQLDAVAARLLKTLSVCTPLLPGAGETTFIDDTVREVHGYAKQGAGFGYSGVRGLNALLATLSTPTSAPVIAAARLRKGSVNSARGARRIVADALAVAKTADLTHRAHAIVEQVIAELKNGPLAHLPSAVFNANAAWLTLATIAFNVTRAAGCLAGPLHARATTGTLRARLINVPARLARSARRLTLHLPKRWPWQTGWTALFTATTGPPTAMP